MADPRRDRKVLAFLRWLYRQGGVVGADDPHLDRWSGDREPTDTLNLAFEAKLAVQRGGEDEFTLHLLPAGRNLIAPPVPERPHPMTTTDDPRPAAHERE